MENLNTGETKLPTFKAKINGKLQEVYPVITLVLAEREEERVGNNSKYKVILYEGKMIKNPQVRKELIIALENCLNRLKK